ncbi:hypothetical protein [Nonomuraea longicatena]|uniref:Uncharacterized protein n=1 Tax=Nonomuraea longicatena TaxID=83682 RepID=A0ABN1PZH3_9ACTN
MTKWLRLGGKVVPLTRVTDIEIRYVSATSYALYVRFLDPTDNYGVSGHLINGFATKDEAIAGARQLVSDYWQEFN